MKAFGFGFSRIIAVFLFGIVFASAMSPGADDNQNGGAGAGDWTIYLGVDFTLEHEGAACPVLWADDRSVAIVHRDGKTVWVSGQIEKMRSTVVPRVGRTRVSIENVLTTKLDTRYQGDQIESMRQQIAAEDIRESNMERANAARAMAESVVQMGKNMEGTRFEPTAAEMTAAQARVDATAGAQTAAAASTQHLNLPGARAGDNDAFQVTFSISAPAEVANPHGVLRLMIRDPANPSSPVGIAKFFKIRRIGTSPSRVSVIVSGLPLGFEIKEYAINMYADDREMPTTVSPNRVDVTADEAHQFLVLQHVQANRAASVPVSVVRELLPEYLSTLISSALQNVEVDIVVDQSGHATEVTPLPGAATGLGHDVETALRAVRFLPALLNGRPVASEGRFALSEFLP